jgi:hypothetical protein
MNFGVTVLLIISGWALLSIVVSVGFGGIAKTRDRVTGAGFRIPSSDPLAAPRTDAAPPRATARRTA